MSAAAGAAGTTWAATWATSTAPFATRCGGSSTVTCRLTSPSGSGPTTIRPTCCPILADLGVLGMSIPEEFGGSDLDLVGYALVFEELARGWMGLASVVGSSRQRLLAASGRYGTDEQRRRFLPDLAAGRRVSGIALTEPSTGSDLKAIKLSARAPRRPLRRQRHEDDDHPGPPRRSARRAGRDRPVGDPPASRHDPAARRAGHARLLGRPGHRQARPPGRGAVRGASSTTPSCRWATCSAASRGRALHQMLAALDRGRIYMAAVERRHRPRLARGRHPLRHRARSVRQRRSASTRPSS